MTRQVPKSWHMPNGSVLTKGRSTVSLKFFEYSNSKEYLVTPEVVSDEREKGLVNDVSVRKQMVSNISVQA